MIVAITAFNRPHYLRQMLDSLERADAYLDEPVFVTARIEPSEHQDEIVDMFSNRRGWYWTLNDEQAGHVDNIRYAFEGGFALGDRVREDFVVWLADDLVISEDALACSAFMRDHWRDDPQVVSTALHWQRSEPEDTAYLACGLRANIHNSQGHGIWESSWAWHVGAWEPVTSKRKRGIDPPGYQGNDQNISARLRADDKRQAAPLLSRVFSVGYEGGMHATAETLAGDNPAMVSDDVDLPSGTFREATPAELQQPYGAWARYEAQLLRET